MKKFLEEVAAAADVTDINIAAGKAAQRLERRPSRRIMAYALGLILALDLFASSPIHAGVIGIHPHLFTKLGATDYAKYGPNVFGHRLPW